jgi:F0F1-type ATP synthase delta subunit
MEEINLSEFFHTKAQANDFSARLSAIVEKIYQTDFNLDKMLIEEFGLQKKDKLIIFLRNNKVNTQSSSELNSFFNKLIEDISKLPILSLSIAFNPKEETLRILSEWFLLNYKNQVLFEITINPDLVAGSAISFNGKYRDYSVKPKFEKIIKDAVENKNNFNTNNNVQTTPLGGHQSTEYITLGR